MSDLISQLENLPDRVLLTNILPQYNLEDLLDICSKGTRLSRVCRDPILWNFLIRRDFNTVAPPQWHPMDYYVFLSRSRVIPVYVNGQHVDNVRFNPNTVSMAIDQIVSKVPAQDFYLIFAREDDTPNVLIKFPENAYFPFLDLNKTDKIVVTF